MSWYLLKNRRHQGPYTLEQLKQAYSDGRASSRDYCITEADLSDGRVKYLSLRELIPTRAEDTTPRLPVSISQIQPKVESNGVAVAGGGDFKRDDNARDDNAREDNAVERFENVNAADLVAAATLTPDSVDDILRNEVLSTRQLSPLWAKLQAQLSSPTVKKLGFAVASILVVAFTWSELSQRISREKSQSTARKEASLDAPRAYVAPRPRSQSSNSSVRIPPPSQRHQNRQELADRMPKPMVEPRSDISKDAPASEEPPPSPNEEVLSPVEENSAPVETDSNIEVSEENPSAINDDRMPQSAVVEEEVIP